MRHPGAGVTAGPRAPRRLNRREPWRCLISPCASCSRLARISATSRTAGTRRWRRTSSAPATTSTSSTSPRRCRCCIARCRRCPTPSPRAAGCCSSAPSARPRTQIADAAKRSAQYYVNSRWLGGMLTNWKTISASISRLRKVDEMLGRRARKGLTKKERLMLSRERDKLEKALGGIKDMGGVPDLGVRHRHQQGAAGDQGGPAASSIPVAAIVDTNCDPDGITFPVPGQRRRRPRHHALLRPHRPRGDRRHLAQPGRASGVDLGAAEAPIAEELPATVEPRRCRAEPAIERVRAPGRAARRAGRSGQAHRRRPADRQEAQRAGVFHYWQLAAMTPEDAAKLDADLRLNGRIERDGWIDQARALIGRRSRLRARAGRRAGDSTYGRGARHERRASAMTIRKEQPWRPSPPRW